MNKPTLSIDGACPGCAGTDWKLCKVLVAFGTATLEADSSGGGFGVAAGAGDGQRGVSINYQSVNLDTSGTLRSSIAEQYAPPPPPAQSEFRTLNTLLEERARLRADAEGQIRKIEDFAVDTFTLQMGFWQKPSTNFDRLARSHAGFSEKIAEWRKYEYELAVWNATRVCMRCGERFILRDAHAAIAPPAAEPPFSFEGQDRRCPKCLSYSWKRGREYIFVRRAELRSSVRVAERRLKQAREDEANLAQSKGLARFWRKLTSGSPAGSARELEQARTNWESFEKAITESPILERAAKAIIEFSLPDDDDEPLRVCLDCAHTYTLQRANRLR